MKITDLYSKITRIKTTFLPLLNQQLHRFQTAEILLENNEWDPWPDLPIRLHAYAQQVISISWSEFDDLSITNDLSTPFPTEGYPFRWVNNQPDLLLPILNKTIRNVFLAKGQLSIEDTEYDIYTRLLIQPDNQHYLEIFNALDENSYAYHKTTPTTDLIP